MRVLILLAAAFLWAASAAQAQPIYGKPVYDPASKSYFELVKVTRAMSPGSDSPNLSWDRADRAASGRAFNGTPGRLATIRSQDTHMFILEHLRPNEAAWIGLRYLCKQRQLQWVDGHPWTKGQFQAWHAQWDQAGIAGCAQTTGGGVPDWMPVMYSPVGEGFRWIAKGGKKGYVAFIVEYPTGKP